MNNIPKLKVGELYFVYGHHEFIKHIGLMRFLIISNNVPEVHFILDNSIVMVLGIGRVWTSDEFYIKVLHENRVGYIPMTTEFVNCKNGLKIDPTQDVITWSDLPIEIDELHKRKQR